jgi:hypothetical protein
LALIVKDWAPATAQVKVVDCPFEIVKGVAEKLEIFSGASFEGAIVRQPI